MKPTLSSRATVSAVLLLGLAACGGGGGGSEAVTPVADSSTLAIFLAYQKTLAPAAVIDPATLQSQLAPVSDIGEPTPLN